MNFPLIERYDQPLLPDFSETDRNAPDAVPLPGHVSTPVRPARTVAVSGLQVARDHPSGVTFDEKDGCIVGPGISNMLGLRLLRSYFHPEAVEIREAQRKARRDDVWQELRPIDQKRLIGWATCACCRENAWCIIYNADESLHDHKEFICEPCFYSDVDCAPF